jgi:hypothetical protein
MSHEARAPIWPGRCAGWWTEYERIANGEQIAYVDASVTLYRTHAQAMTALMEPAYDWPKALRNGGAVRLALDGGGAASVIRNVFISTVSSHLPTDAAGVPDFAGGPDIGLAAQLRIHNRIHSAVLRLR